MAIEIRLDPIKSDAFEKSMDKVAAKVDALDAKMRGLGRGAGRGGAGGGSGGGPGVRGGQYPTGSFEARANTFLRSMRFGGSGGGFMPLLGRTVDLFLPKSGLLGAAIGAAAGLLTRGVSKMAASGSDSLAGISTSMAGTGGTAGQASYMKGLGLDSGAAASFGEALRGGGVGAAYFRSKGIVDYGYRTTNKLDNLIKALDALAKIENRGVQQMVAQTTGLTGYLPFVQASPEIRRATTYTAKKYAGTEEDVQNKRDFDALLSGAQAIVDSFHRAAYRLGTAPVVQLSKGIQNLTEGNWGKGVTQILDMIPGLQTEKWFGLDKEGEKKTGDPLWDSVDALRENSRALKDHAEQIKGGAYTSGAKPRAWHDLQLEMALQSGMQSQLGYFK